MTAFSHVCLTLFGQCNVGLSFIYTSSVHQRPDRLGYWHFTNSLDLFKAKMCSRVKRKLMHKSVR